MRHDAFVRSERSKNAGVTKNPCLSKTFQICTDRKAEGGGGGWWRSIQKCGSQNVQHTDLRYGSIFSRWNWLFSWGQKEEEEERRTCISTLFVSLVLPQHKSTKETPRPLWLRNNAESYSQSFFLNPRKQTCIYAPSTLTGVWEVWEIGYVGK